MFDYGLNIKFDFNNLEFIFSEEVFHPKVTEKRKLNEVRNSLLNYNSKGPDILYSISMDVGNKKEENILKNSNLLLGVCIYSKGLVGEEPVRSQGHVHSVSKTSNYSTGELYEIWYGKAMVVMQEFTNKNPGRVFAVEASEGEVVFVPPGWAHYTINVNPKDYMVFGAWCIRDYGFDYNELREKAGLSVYPIFNDGKIEFIKNSNYSFNFDIINKKPRKYNEFNIDGSKSIYSQFIEDKNRFNFVTNPRDYLDKFQNFIP